MAETVATQTEDHTNSIQTLKKLVCDRQGEIALAKITRKVDSVHYPYMPGEGSILENCTPTGDPWHSEGVMWVVIMDTTGELSEEELSTLKTLPLSTPPGEARRAILVPVKSTLVIYTDCQYMATLKYALHCASMNVFAGVDVKVIRFSQPLEVPPPPPLVRQVGTIGMRSVLHCWSEDDDDDSIDTHDSM